MKPIRIARLLWLLFLVIPIFAEVTLKNGNYFVGYTDLAFTGGFAPKIERVYNSKTSFKGIFGNGWGNEYEVYLELTGDGSVLVNEYGGGANNRFDSPNLTADEVAKAADLIVAAAKARGDISGDVNLAAYRDALLADAARRQREWDSYTDKHLIQPRTLPVGTKLLSMSFSYETITVEPDGYRRDFDNGRVERFGKDGKLRQISDKNGNYVRLSYDTNDITLSDNYQHSLVLFQNERGLVTRIEASDGRKCAYRYNERDELVYAQDADGQTYLYTYDALGRHNMTGVTYPDKTIQKVDYYPRDQFENVKSVTDRDGTVTDYAYNIDPKDHRHYTVSVKSSAPSSASGKLAVVSDNSYEYFNLSKTSGAEYTSRMITTIDGDRRDTTYNVDGLPTRIERGTEVTLFAYDAKGHITRKETPLDITLLSYDPSVSKVTSVQRTNKATGKIDSESHFAYDPKGNLVTASSGETLIHLRYDTLGRIQQMDPAGRGSISFAYNQNSKPVKICILAHKEADGSNAPETCINVSYTSEGDIDKVDSPNGRAASLKVTSAFQSLLEVIRPADVTLSF